MASWRMTRFTRRDGSTSFAPRTLVRVGRCRGLSLTCRSIRAAENSCHDRFRQSTRRLRLERGTSAGCNFHDDERWDHVVKGPDPRRRTEFSGHGVNTGSGERHLLSSTPVNRFQLLSQRLVAVPGRRHDSVAHGTDPRTSNVANRHAQLFAIVSSNTFVMSEGEPGGGGQHSRLSLSESSDAGITWRHLDDPCAGLGSDQLVTYSSQRWLLSCFLGVGMNQGIGALWHTNNGGATWSRVFHGDEEATTLVPAEMAASSSGGRRSDGRRRD